MGGMRMPWAASGKEGEAFARPCHSPPQVQRPGVEPLIFRDIFIFRTLGSFVNAW